MAPEEEGEGAEGEGEGAVAEGEGEGEGAVAPEGEGAVAEGEGAEGEGAVAEGEGAEGEGAVVPEGEGAEGEGVEGTPPAHPLPRFSRLSSTVNFQVWLFSRPRFRTTHHRACCMNAQTCRCACRCALSAGTPRLGSTEGAGMQVRGQLRAVLRHLVKPHASCQSRALPWPRAAGLAPWQWPRPPLFPCSSLCCSKLSDDL